MDKKYNGSGKKPADDKKIIRFPAPGARARKAQVAGAAGKAAPFINLEKIPIFTRTMIAVLLLVHVGLLLVDEGTRYQIFYTFGFVPAYFSGAATGFSKFGYLGPVTHMFIHAGWMHILFNSIMALTFGILFEREFGAKRAAVFWVACGMAGALVYFLLNPALASPMIGASGSISGLFAAAILSMHTQKQRMGAPGGRGPWPLLIFWLAFMVFTGMISGNDTAWQAHAGGFVCGAGLYYVFLKKRARI